MNGKSVRLAVVSCLLAVLGSFSVQAGIYTFNYTDSGPIPQGGTVFSAEHGVTGVPSSISSIELVLTFNTASSLLGTSSGIQGHLLLGTGESSPFVNFYAVDNDGNPATHVYDVTLSGTPGSPGTGFGGLDPNTTWGLVLWDNSSSGIENKLLGWSLDITPVPEPVNIALGIFGGAVAVVTAARSRPVRSRAHRVWVGINQWIDAV
jgi:hypothetical protein